MLAQYYADANVRMRLLEFLGGNSLESVSSVYITADDRSPSVRFDPRPVADLPACLDRGLDLGRSLWDRKFLVAHLDVEHVNFDHPAEAYLEPGRAFEIQRPVVRAIQEILLSHGIVPLHLLSGRGHHFVWQLSRTARAFERLARLGHLCEPVAECYARPHPPTGEVIEHSLGCAFAGLGQVMEYLAQRVLETSAAACQVPLQLTAVETGPGSRGREIVSIDISEYGDPLHTRGIRMPFSAYLKPQQQRGLLGKHFVEALPPLFVIPLHEIDERDGLLVMRDVGEVRALARRASVRIPDHSDAMENLVSAYADSTLAGFHESYYVQEHDPPHVWRSTYDRMSFAHLPQCVRAILERPNDLLLKPAGIQHVVRVLLANGWHPRHIAGLIRSRYERNHGWGGMWYRYNACSRADFYVRLFAGLFELGKDDLVDFNCRSTQEKRYCPVESCDCNLIVFRDLLLERRRQDSIRAAL